MQGDSKEFILFANNYVANLAISWIKKNSTILNSILISCDEYELYNNNKSDICNSQFLKVWNYCLILIDGYFNKNKRFSKVIEVLKICWDLQIDVVLETEHIRFIQLMLGSI